MTTTLPERASSLVADLAADAGDATAVTATLARVLEDRDATVLLALALRETFGDRMRPDPDHPDRYHL